MLSDFSMTIRDCSNAQYFFVQLKINESPYDQCGVTLHSSNLFVDFKIY